MKGIARRSLVVALLLMVGLAVSLGAAEKVTVTWATLAGFYTDWAKSLAQEFTAKTGIDVKIEEMDLPTMYEKEVHRYRREHRGVRYHHLEHFMEKRVGECRLHLPAG